MSYILDNSHSENPFTIIREVHEIFINKIHEHCAAHILKYKWIKNYNIEVAFSEYKRSINDDIYKNWKSITNKIIKEVKSEFDDMVDDWVLESIASINLDKEIEKAFHQEWRMLGPRPDYFA